MPPSTYTVNYQLTSIGAFSLLMFFVKIFLSMLICSLYKQGKDK